MLRSSDNRSTCFIAGEISWIIEWLAVITKQVVARFVSTTLAKRSKRCRWKLLANDVVLTLPGLIRARRRRDCFNSPEQSLWLWRYLQTLQWCNDFLTKYVSIHQFLSSEKSSIVCFKRICVLISAPYTFHSINRRSTRWKVQLNPTIRWNANLELNESLCK